MTKPLKHLRREIAVQCHLDVYAKGIPAIESALGAYLRAVLEREPSEELADRVCKAFNWEPLGTENKVVEGKWHSVTFRELAKGYIRAMSAALLKELGNE
jgi:hypothetical protein